MENVNPYAPPVADEEREAAPGASEIFRQGATIVVPRPWAELPRRCVRCNSEVSTARLAKTVRWHHPIFYTLIVAGPIIYIVVALIAQKRTTVAFWLCDQHRVRRRNGFLVGWGGVLFGVSGCTGGIVANNDGLVMLGLLTACLLPIVGYLMARGVHATRIDARHAWLRVGTEFLKSIPSRAPDRRVT